MKRKVHISGELLFPLTKGKSAVITRQGDIIRTSTVVLIREKNDDYVCFETVNSVYYVSMKPMANAARAAIPTFLKMCA